MYATSQQFRVSVGDRSFDIEVGGKGLTIGGRPATASIVHVRGAVYSLILDHKSYEVVLRGSGAEWQVSIQGQEIPVIVKGAKEQLLDAFSHNTAGSPVAHQLVAPMPGLVLRVNVKAGDTVAAGQEILVLEAMKMENELRAPAAGTVRHVYVAPGAAVAKNAPLVEFDA